MTTPITQPDMVEVGNRPRGFIPKPFASNSRGCP